jgi:flagellar FliL protein
MAEKETKEEAHTDKKQSKNGLMIVIVIVLMLIIIGGAVTVFLLMSGDEKDAAAQHGAPPAQEKTAPASAGASTSAPAKAKSEGDDVASRKLSEIGILYPLDTFTVNLKSDAGRRYLKATISLELKGPELSIELDKKAAVIRDRIIRILTSKSIEEISSTKGKQKVSEQIVDILNSMISDGSIKGIYFTEFVIQ